MDGVAGSAVSRDKNRHTPLVERSRVPSVRPTLRSSTYVVAVALIATVGFTEESPWPILLAAMLTLPASIVAVPCYYFAYGILALIPGAKPSSSTGYGMQNAPGSHITSVVTGEPAAWFTVTTLVVGILTMTVAAILNVLLRRAFAARRRRTGEVRPPSTSPDTVPGRPPSSTSG